MAVTQTNTAYLALPLFLLLFNTVVPVAGIIVVQAIFNFSIVLGLELTSNNKTNQSPYYKATSVIFKTPILIGIILGLIVSGYQCALPVTLTNTFNIVKQAAPFIALLTLGLSFESSKLSFTVKEKSELVTLILFKSFLHPLIAFFIGQFIFQLPPFDLICLVLMAAMPTAKNLFIFAKRYRVSMDRANIIVLVTTILSI